MIEPIVKNLKTLLISEYNTILNEFDDAELNLSRLTESNVNEFYIDIDKFKLPVMVFILPEAEIKDKQTFASYINNLEIKIIIVVRNASEEKLFQKLLRYTSAFKVLIENNPTLFDEITETYFTEIEYFHAVEGSPTIKACEITLNCLDED